MKTIQNATLKDINSVEPFSPENPRDIKCFDEIRGVLVKYGYLDRFGVCLLHRHFDVFSDEKLVESCNHSARVLSITPVSDSELPTNGTLIETSWSLNQAGPLRPVSCNTYCWEDSNGSHNTSHSKE
jgi:hypothetical protein